MPVYSYRMMISLENALSALARETFSKMPLILNADEFVSAFIAPEHVALLQEVESLCRPSKPDHERTILATSEGDSWDMSIQFIGGASVIPPQYIRHGLQPTCPQPVKDKIDQWIAERARFGQAFGDVQDGLAFLNQNCGDVEAMTLLMPCLPSIMAELSPDGDSKVVKRAQKLTSIKRFGRLPRIPRQVTARLIESSAIVNATTLMKDAPLPTLQKHDARLTFSSGTSRRINIFYQNAEPNTPVPVASFI